MQVDKVEAIVQHLLINGWLLDGSTQEHSYRSHSFAFGGGPIVKTGGRARLKRGDMSISVGKRTLCLYKKPDNPETLPGRGPLAGRNVLTFRDWPMRYVQVKSKRDGGAAATIDSLDQAIIEFSSTKVG